MNKIIGFFLSMAVYLCAPIAFADMDRNQLAVWANEAIIATYTYNYKNYIPQQKEIAKYFTAAGWINYRKALTDSKLPESIQKNQYDVSAVATFPPKITTLDATHWQATMPILVVYQNPQYQQKQQLKVVISFSKASGDQGVRGLSISSLQSTVTEPPCVCCTHEKI